MPRHRRPAATAAGGTLAALALAALPSAAVANDAGSITHTSGAVTATVAWDKADFGIANPRLTITRSGVAYDVTISDVCLEGCIIVPDEATTKPGESALKVADLDRDGEPEVLVDTFSGGAHCCVTARVLTWNGSGYTAKDIEYGDVSYTLRDADGDGRPELVGYDPRFSAAFTAYAASGFPIQVLQVQDGDTLDVTRGFRKLVAKDAKRNLADVRRARKGDDVRGVLAAYVADLYLLNQGKKAGHELDRQVTRHRVTKGYKKLLLKRLLAWGYR